MTSTAKRPKFTAWRTSIDEYAEYFGIEGSFVDKVDAMFRETSTHRRSVSKGYQDDFFHAADLTWHMAGRPYYKIWPGMMHSLCNIKLDIPTEAFHMPYQTFVVMLPEPLRGMGKTIQFTIVDRSIFSPDVNGNDALLKEEDKRGDKIRFSMQLHGRCPDKGLCCSIATAFSKGTMQDAIDECNASPLADGEVDNTGTDERRNAFAIVIAVAFFGIDNHEVVCPDIKKPIIDSNCRPKLRKMREENAIKKHEREVAKCKGWLVGSEIDLPRPEIINQGDVRQGTGTELTAGHVRSGHMRMQPHGQGLKDRKLIFVPPTVVRPDLPFRQTHGYRIRG